MRTEIVCTHAVEQWGISLKYVPENKITELLCIVPQQLRTQLVCMEAL